MNSSDSDKWSETKEKNDVVHPAITGQSGFKIQISKSGYTSTLGMKI